MVGGSSRLRRWIDSGTRAIFRERERLDAINVFPVADSDTGTNIYLTLRRGIAPSRAFPRTRATARSSRLSPADASWARAATPA